MEPALTWVDLDEGHRDRALRRVATPAPAQEARGRAPVPVIAPGARAVAPCLLRPPEGAELELAIGCVPTADPETLRRLGAALGDPRRLLVFADARTSAAAASADPRVHLVAAPNGGAFHPSVWLARFRGPKGIRLRVVVLSGDLGPASPSCVALVTETTPSPRQASRPSRALAELLQALPSLATGPLPPEARAALSSLADDVGRARFPGPAGLDGGVTFHVPGLPGSPRAWIQDRRASRVLAFAPVVRPAPLERLAGLGARDRILVSTREQLDGLPAGTLDRWHRVLAVDPGPAEAVLGGRLVAVERGFDVTWWLGSADLSAEAWSGHNVELLAEVTGRKGREGGKTGHGIGRFLQSGFGSLCSPHRSPGGSSPGG